MADEFNSMEDLAFSRSFRNWVLNRDAAERAFWENWIARNPDKAEMVKYAKAVIHALHTNSTVLSPDEINEEVRKAVVRLKEAPRYIPLDSPGESRRRWASLVWSIWLAVTLVAAVGIGGYLIYRVHSHRDGLQAFLSSHKNDSVRQEVADVSADHAVNLPDGSFVRLGKSGKLYYTAGGGQGQLRREVFLQGEAYFDIRKNPGAPFFVYTDQTIIKALGTSFIVCAIPSLGRMTVTAVTGGVFVYRQEDFYGHPAAGSAPTGLILTPNQEGVYDPEGDRLYRILVGAPAPLDERQDTAIHFGATPAREVFGRLHELYGIPILYDEELARHCLVTATLGKGSFFDKLDIICKAIDGKYEMIDGNIVVTMGVCQ
jgi:transmembrane sensor